MPSPFTERLQGTREDLINSGMYLGDIDNAFRQEVTWRYVGNEKWLLVTKESADAVDGKPVEAEATAESSASVTVTAPAEVLNLDEVVAADSPASTATVSSTDPEDNANDEAVGTVLVPAQLSVVLLCSPDSWLTPCDFWRGPTQFTRRFADLKISLAGGCPPDKFYPFSEDFRVVRENVAWLKNQIKVDSRGATCQGFVVEPKGSTNISLKFRHILFEVSPLGSPPENT